MNDAKEFFQVVLHLTKLKVDCLEGLSIVSLQVVEVTLKALMLLDQSDDLKTKPPDHGDNTDSNKRNYYALKYFVNVHYFFDGALTNLERGVLGVILVIAIGHILHEVVDFYYSQSRTYRP